MQNQVQIFQNEEFGEVRVIQKDGQPWWVLRDVCKALALSNPTAIAKRLDDDEKAILKTKSDLVLDIPNRGLTIITESGLYAVILRSDKPQARAFRKWITSAVIPAIRKFGAYATPETLDFMESDPEFTAELIRNLAKTHAKNLALMDQVEALQPKAQYCDVILQCEHAVPTTLIAKDYGLSAQSFNKLLHDLRIQYRIGGVWFLYKDHADKGYTVTKTYYVGKKQVSIHTAWTQRGRKFLYDALAWYGIYPVIERLGEVA
jgi:prophage antirepressor-like protein